jgi:hypothetical protein
MQPGREQELWIGVLGQAINDALGRSSYNRNDYRRDGGTYDPRLEALAWFKANGDDYRMVAALAGLDADALRERVLTGRVRPIYLGGPEPRKRRPARTKGRAA